ncbi:hypothetical protein FHT00_001768 [Sphingomonas insulae]|nr:hypothetical protein [Sphingomonas insulae]NIJ29821.1 hypothetical protein [Sphingomonas insulae]
MLKTNAAVGFHAPPTADRVPPLTGVMIGTAISLLLWAMILATFFAMR